jgi:spore coat protein CotH
MKLSIVRGFVGLLCFSFASLDAAQQEPTTAEFFDVDTVRDIRITVDEDDWKELCSETRNMVNSLDLVQRESPYHYVKAEMTVDGVSVGTVGLRKKGFLGSQDSRRPSLKVRIDKYQKGRTFAGLDRLTLNNNKQDRGLVSQHLTYDSFRRVGLAAPRLSFAHVWVNGNDLGVYSNVESARPTFLRHHFGGDGGKMYEGTAVDFMTDRIVRFERKFDDKKPDDRSVLLSVARLVEEKDVDVEELERFVALDDFFKFWAMESLIGFWDGYCGNQNNYFVYSHHDDQRLHFIPWGADVAFVKQLIGQLFKAGGPESAASFAMLPNRLYQNEEMRKRYFETLDKLLNSVWDEERLLAETHRIDELLKPHICESQRDHIKQADAVRRFIKSRRAEIVKELKDGYPTIKFHKRKTVCASEVGTVEGSFNLKWADDDNAERSISLELTLDGTVIKLRDVNAEVATGGGNPLMGLPTDAVTLQISATRDDNEKPIALSVIVSGLVFTSKHKHPATAHGSFVEGKSGFFRSPRNLSVAGKVKFDKCGREKGDAVVGKFTLRLLQVDDGFPKRKKRSKSEK